MNQKRRIAVIGGGISGLSAAWLLRKHANVTLFEANGRFGGHTNTVRVVEGDREIPIDTGFMVFNRPNYPLLSALFDHIEVPTHPTRMSFSVSLDDGAIEFAGGTVGSLFAQRRNLVRVPFWGMLGDILRFNRLAQLLVRTGSCLDHAITLGELLDHHRFGKSFRHWYLYPMAAAIWSCPRDQMARFPAASFLRFFSNHGLVQLTNRPRWETVVGGASTYVNRLISDLGSGASAARAVVDIRRTADGVIVRDEHGAESRFDDVVLACHPDQASRIIQDPTPSERVVLNAVRYQQNHVYLHTDEALMPRRRGLWSSWNYIGQDISDARSAVSVSYWMNSLQPLNSRRNYFVSLNPPLAPKDEEVVAELSYDHPVFDVRALQAQTRLAQIQGQVGESGVVEVTPG